MTDRFIKACRREKTDTTPVWFMRQAGRFLPEYRKIRSRHDLLEICKDPELCAEVSTQPVEILDVDAAILFADIMLPLEGMGVKFKIKEGVGPIIKSPIENFQNANSLTTLDPSSDVSYVLDAILTTKKRLDSRAPLIGFCGAPFTLATYLIEGHATREFTKTKRIMYTDSKTWHFLMEKLSTSMTSYLRAQIKAGVDAVQIFDSWVGCLSPQDYHKYVLQYSQSIFDQLRETNIPCIHFGTGSANLLDEMKSAGGNVIGVDWRIAIDVAWSKLGFDVAIQGNLDPAVLLADTRLIKAHAADILKRIDGRPGHIFNLGHGLLPNTPRENVTELVKFVHEYTKENS
ncbi:MAG TPA: uroporphyrinogen decarboxylase [Candidatus Bathyarchaeia archaeon]|nr:uroporphyrinogen decarboxylase [Candidatus Bathyarchaeia archaeon]